jgi:pimeloyl-ACP methyl ester carboxylesterase
VRYLAMSNRATPAQVAFCERMFLRCRPDVRAAFGATLAGVDLVSALGDLTVPTVVVAAELDRLTPPVHARAMVKVLPDARLVELPATGHTSPLEAHTEVTHIIRAVVAGPLDAPSRAATPSG